MQTPLQLDVWLQSYKRFDNAKNNMKQRNLNTVFAISQKQHPDIRLIPLDHVTYFTATLLLDLWRAALL